MSESENVAGTDSLTDNSTTHNSAVPDSACVDTASVEVELQWQAQRDSRCPQDEEIRHWVRMAIRSEVIESGAIQSATLNSETAAAAASAGPVSDSLADSVGELTVRIVDSEEMQSANHQWRNADKSTNVLSFPSDFPPETGLKYYGDMLICAEVLATESVAQGKSDTAHWAHIVIHGTLHLLGYDHVDAADAAVMEKREIEILATLGFPNPYLTVGETEIPLSEVSKS